MDKYLLFSICLITFVLFPGIILNLGIFIVLLKMEKQRKSYFALVKSLILADLVLSLFFSLCIIAFLFDIEVPSFGDAKIWNTYFYDICFYFTEYLLYVILLNLIALASEHYVAIIKPLHYVNWVRCRYIVCRLCAIWIIPVLLCFFGYLVPHKYIMIENRYPNFTLRYPYEVNWRNTFRVPFVLLCFIIMAITYIHIYCIVRKQQRLQQLQNQHAKNNKKALVTTIFNLLSFFLCWFPPLVAEIWFQIYQPSNLDDFINFTFWMNYVIQDIVFINSICDPLIYAVRLSAVRKVWKRKFCCFLCHRKPPLKKLQVEMQNMSDHRKN